jgi:hypothetical protein
VTFVVSAALVIAGRRPARHLATFTAAGLLFQLLTLVQPSPFIGLVLVLATIRPGVVIRSFEKVTGRAR